ncbi:MAG: spore maturation protein [Clostridia bacterium]|nr:spore maturation protein [Clostridia bacterium]
MKTISAMAIPVILLVILAAALFKNIPVYDTFLGGAKKGLKTTVGIIVPLVGLLSAVSMFRASGALELICHGLSPLTKILGFPPEALPLAVLRPVSGSASLAVLRDILNNHGADSFAGRVASVISGSTETTLYTLTVYYGAVGIKNARHTLKSALLADFTGFAIAAVAVGLFFSR